MSTQRRFQIRVVGEGKPRASGVLAFVVPQVLDLLSATSYVVSIRETPAGAARGVLRLHRLDHDGNVAAVWESNPNIPSVNQSAPSWCSDVIRMSQELGRNITWTQQS